MLIHDIWQQQILKAMNFLHLHIYSAMMYTVHIAQDNALTVNWLPGDYVPQLIKQYACLNSALWLDK